MPSSIDTPSYAIIEGALCKLSRRGTVIKRHVPLGIAVEQFIVAEGKVFVRENADGFLSGMSNVYCLDDRLHLVWLAELPTQDGAIASALEIDQNSLLGTTRAGLAVRISADSGKLE